VSGGRSASSSLEAAQLEGRRRRAMAALDWPSAMQVIMLLVVGSRPPPHIPNPGQSGACSRRRMIKARRSLPSSANHVCILHSVQMLRMSTR
jgi:hypothetical protein